MISKQGKQKVVEEVGAQLAKHKVIAVASISGLKSRQFNAIKKKLRGQAELIVARKTLIQMAIEKNKPEVKALETYMQGAEILVLSNLDPFKLFKLFKQNKTKTPAKAGQLAPHDIVIPAGETNLAPGPVLTELKQAKIDAKIQGPKIVITKDAVVARAGQPISPQAAGVLSKLGIEPMEVGIELKAAYDNGTVYPGEILNVDEEATLAQLVKCHQQAINLAVYAEVFNSTSMEILLMKAAREAKALSALSGAAEPKKEEQAQGATETPAEAQAPPAA
ncbi:MAG: 50S ribosomal protein L10 [Candidatus Micrarchaeota archaeon]|nr:50S ribosomal protein L10 [Candidatus Micrarchaeota archaeon]